MKKVILGICTLSLVAFTSCKEDASSKIKDENVAQAAERDANSGKLPVLEFDKTEHDFGNIENGTPVETVFTYKNVGESPLVVTDIKSTCGCTVPQDWDRTPLATGESSTFTVKFNGKGNGMTTKSLTVVANTAKGNEVVRIKANINNPNAAAQGLKPAPVQASPMSAANAVRKSSTKPGHEGHNHD